jgi:F-type H+-transporting ATPase subunit delta
VDVSEASISTGIAQRYATAVFELAKESKKLAAVEKDLDALDAALVESADLAAMIASPVYSRGEQASAVTALAAKMGLSTMIAGALGVMAEKRRLFILPQFISGLRAAIAEDKGEVTAEVTAAKAMTKAQQDKLAKALKASVQERQDQSGRR